MLGVVGFFKIGGIRAYSICVRLDPCVHSSRHCGARHVGIAMPTVDVRAGQSVLSKDRARLDHQLRERVLLRR